MKKERVLKIVLFIAAVCLMAALLVSCGMTSTGTTNKKKDANSGSEITEEKIALTDAVKNYDDKDVKRSNIEANGALEIYFANGNNGEYKKSKVGTRLKLTRMENEDKYYAKAMLLPGDVSDEVVGLLTTVKDYCEGNTGLIGRLSYETLSDDKKEKLKAFAPYLTYVQAFLQGKITLNAEAGYEDDSLNVKAAYKYNKTNTEVEQDELWCAADVGTLAGVIPGATEEKLTSLFIDPLLKLAVLSNGTDSASDRVSTTGEAKYEIKPDITTEKDAINDVMSSLFEILDVEANETLVNMLFQKIGKWVTVESDSKIDITVDKDKMPDWMLYNVKVVFNLPVREFKETIVELKKYGLSDDAASLINTMITAINLYICGANGEPEKVGFAIDLSVREEYLYAGKDTIISSDKGDLYISADEDETDRVELDKMFRSLSAEQVGQFISKIEEMLNTDNAEEIGNAINEKVKDVTGISLYELGKATADVLREYLKNDETLKETVESIIEKIVKGEIKLTVKADEEQGSDGEEE